MTRTLVSPRLASVLPFGPVSREMDELMERFFGSQNGGSFAPKNWYAPVSVWEEEGKFFVDVDVPGVKAEDIDVTFEDGTLRIVAERRLTQTNDQENGRKYWHHERAYGRIERTVSLPESLDRDSIEANLTEGVLHLSIARRPETQPKKVTVKAS